MEHSKSSCNREVDSNTILPEKHQKDILTLHLKQLEKEEEQQQKKKQTKVSRRKEIIKV